MSDDIAVSIGIEYFEQYVEFVNHNRRRVLLCLELVMNIIVGDYPNIYISN